MLTVVVAVATAAAVTKQSYMSLAGNAGGDGYENYACMGATLTYSAMIGNGGYGAHQSPSAGSTPTANHNGYFNNAGGALGLDPAQPALLSTSQAASLLALAVALALAHHLRRRPAI